MCLCQCEHACQAVRVVFRYAKGYRYHGENCCLYSYFGDWRVLADEAVADAAPLPPFRPPPSTMAGGLSLISSIFATRFKDDDYIMAGLRRCFVSVGLAPGADGTYAVYTTHDRAKTKAISSRDGSCNGIERQRLA